MTIFIPVVIGALVVLLFPYIGRVIAGPALFDRVVALNAIGSKVPVLFLLFGVLYERTDMFVDLALALFLLNLVTTLLIAKFVENKPEVGK